MKRWRIFFWQLGLGKRPELVGSLEPVTAEKLSEALKRAEQDPFAPRRWSYMTAEEVEDDSGDAGET